MALQTNLGGTGTLTIDGASQPLGASLTEELGGPIRTAKAGLSGPQGATSKFEMGMLDVEFTDNGSLSTDYLQSIQSSVFLWANDNGKSVVYTGVMQVDKISTNPQEATVKAKFSYMKRTEIPA